MGIALNNQYFFKWEYPVVVDGEPECDYRLITAERLLDVLRKEIDSCRESGDSELVVYGGNNLHRKFGKQKVIILVNICSHTRTSEIKILFFKDRERTVFMAYGCCENGAFSV